MITVMPLWGTSQPPPSDRPPGTRRTTGELMTPIALHAHALRRPARIAAVALSASLALSGCISSGSSNDGSDESGDGPLVIGVVMAKSGFMGAVDAPALNALQLAADEMNADGGIDGQKIELKVVDTETKLDRYASAAAELIDDGARALIVTCDYDVSSPAVQAAQAANLVSVAPCVGDPIFGPAGGMPMGFSMGNGTPGEASIIAEFADSKGWKDAVLLKDTSLKYTQNQCDIVEKRFTELGGDVVGSYTFKQGDSVRETVSKIRGGSAPDVVFNCSYTPGGATVAKELRDGGVAAPIVSGAAMDGTFWLDGVPDLTDYYVVTYASMNGDDPDPQVNGFLDRYTKEFGELPSASTFTGGPSTLQALAAAHEKSGSWDGDALTKAMESFSDEKFLVGPTTFSAEQHIDVTRGMRVLKAEGGKLVFQEQRAAEKVVALP